MYRKSDRNSVCSTIQKLLLVDTKSEKIFENIIAVVHLYFLNHNDFARV